MFDRVISVILSLIMLISGMLPSLFPNKNGLRIVVPESWEMDVGDSRTLTCVFSEKEQTGKITFSASPEGIASVDEFGRVTALSTGTANITAECGSCESTVTLNVKATPTLIDSGSSKVDYNKDAVKEVDNLQKQVTRYSSDSAEVPQAVKAAAESDGFKTAVTSDGAVWTVTDYGVLRTDENAATKRDREQRFMGDRYFYSADTTDGKVKAIIPDGLNGIWTAMAEGYTHIAMVKMSGSEKAAVMSETTETYISRRGMTSEAYKSGSVWNSYESDNDGLWTSMFGAGELMRYASLKDSASASEEEIGAARRNAVQATEAVLLLHFISMRNGTTQAYVRRQLNGNFPGDREDRWLSAEALKDGADGSYYIPSESPAKQFSKGYSELIASGNTELILNEGYYLPCDADSWSDTNTSDDSVSYARQTRLLKGFVARTYSLSDENFGTGDAIYWDINGDKTATGVSSLPPDHSNYLINGENMRGAKTDASAEVPKRLWDSLIGSGYTAADVTYKGETSADELIGHMFIFKLAYDILAPEDPELKELLITASDNLAQHLSDNSHMLVDGTGQPTSWSNFSRTSFLTSSAIALAPLHALVVLSIFKVAAYITGYQKWENEYKMLASDPAYEYSTVAAQYSERMQAAISYTVNSETSPALGSLVNLLGASGAMETVKRLVLNYSDEEMAMLAFYVLLQTETDPMLHTDYILALEDWWVSVKYSENPLWYYIYQLAYPNTAIRDAAGNNILETAAWSLSRHPLETICYKASNGNRDDIAALDLSSLGVKSSTTLSFNISGGKEIPTLAEDASTADIAQFALKIMSLDWKVAAPDERAYHKFNGCSYSLETNYIPFQMLPSTTYTLPYWMGVYHGMLEAENP